MPLCNKRRPLDSRRLLLYVGVTCYCELTRPHAYVGLVLKLSAEVFAVEAGDVGEGY